MNKGNIMDELHTKIPLSVFGDDNHIMGIPLEQAEALGLPHVQWTHNAPDDIARRLVACWNHCAGLDTEGMEMGARLGRTARVYMDELVGQCAEAEHQRNELQRELCGARESIQRANERWYSAKRDAAIAEGERDALKAQYDQLREVLERANQVLTGLDAAIAAAKGGA